MKTFILIIKGMLFYTTILVILLWMSGIDSIYDNGYMLISIAIVSSLVFLCIVSISQEDLKKLTFSKYWKDDINDEV